MNSHQSRMVHTVATGVLVLWITVGDSVVVATQYHIRGSDWPNSAQGFPAPPWLLMTTMLAMGLWAHILTSSWGRSAVPRVTKYVGFLFAFFGAIPLCIQTARQVAIMSGSVHGSFGVTYWVVMALITATALVSKIAIWRLWWRLCTAVPPWAWWARPRTGIDTSQVSPVVKDRGR